MDRLAGTVFGHGLEALQVTNIGFGIGMHKDEIRGFNRLGADVGRRRQDRGDRLGVVRADVPGDLAQHAQGDLARHSAARGTAGIVGVGRSLQHAVTHHFADQADTLAALLLHFGGHVILVGIHDLIGYLVEAAVLIQRDGDVLRNKAVSGRRGAFGQDVRRGIHVPSVDGVEVGQRAAIRQVATINNGLAGVLRHLALSAGDAQDFDGDRMGEDFALEFVNPPGWGVIEKLRHGKLLVRPAECFGTRQ